MREQHHPQYAHRPHTYSAIGVTHTPWVPRRARLWLPVTLLLWGVLGITWSHIATATGSLTLNLKDADIEAVIETVSQMTGRNFIVDPRVKAKVTVVSSEPMNDEQIYQLFLSILNVHGFAAIPGNNAIKIVPEVNAKQDAIPLLAPRGRAEPDQYVTQVIKVENVAAAQLVPILRPLLPQQGHLAAMPEANVLIAAASSANIDRLIRIIQRVDLSGDDTFEVVRLQHAAAAEVVRILDALAQGESKGSQRGPGETPTLVADERTNSILIAGGANRLKLRTLITHLDTPLESEGNTEVIYLRYAIAKDLVTVLTGVSKSLQSEQQGQQPKRSGNSKGVDIQADEATNALVVTAPPDIMRGIKSVVRQLDIRRAQVMVEAIIAEVTTNTQNSLGILWGLNGSDSNFPLGLVNFGTAANEMLALFGAYSQYEDSGSSTTVVAADGTTTTTTNARNLPSSLPSLPNGMTLTLGNTSGSNPFGLLLRALAGDADTNIVSTPNLVTLDNTEASIVVGQNVPFLTGSYTSSNNSVSNPFQTIQRQDVGLTLKVKPQINEGDAVRLELTQEFSSLESGYSGASDLITNKRSLQTTVMVEDGAILALGGLMDDQVTEAKQKVPLLGDIPVLGRLFRYDSSAKVKRNLMVFLHPRILRNASQNAAVTSEKYNLLRAQQLQFRERGLTLLPDDATPIMPRWEDLVELPPPFLDSEPTPAPTIAPAAAVEPLPSPAGAE